MKRQLAVCAGLLVLGIGSAQAQTIYAGPSPFEPSAVLPPYEIMSIVRSTGLAPLTRPMRRGAYYVLVAVDRVGRQMRVVVDAQLGDIVNMRPATAANPFGPEPGRPFSAPTAGAPLPDTAAAYGARPGADSAGGGYSPAPAPPRAAAAARAAVTAAPPAMPASTPGAVPSPQARMAVAEPALPPPPPLPRPRPKLALNDAPPAAPTAAPSTPPTTKPVPSPAAVSSRPLPSHSSPAPDAGQIE